MLFWIGYYLSAWILTAFYSQTFYEDTEQYDGRRVSTKYKNIPVSCVPYLEGYLVINKDDL